MTLTSPLERTRPMTSTRASTLWHCAILRPSACLTGSPTPNPRGLYARNVCELLVVDCCPRLRVKKVETPRIHDEPHAFTATDHQSWIDASHPVRASAISPPPSAQRGNLINGSTLRTTRNPCVGRGHCKMYHEFRPECLYQLYISDHTRADNFCAKGQTLWTDSDY